MSRIKLTGLADGSPSPLDGLYVKAYDASGPNTPGMVCLLEATTDPAEALDLPGSEAFELWRSVDEREPVRPDGRPNRPLTAFTVEIS